MDKKPTLPFTWQNLFDWYTQRHFQPVEAYTGADKLWKAFASLLLDEMTDAEVECFAEALSAEHGAHNGHPDITDRVFPRCLAMRLNLIASKKKWAEQHQSSNYRIKDTHHMVALHVNEMDWNIGIWQWEIIHSHLIDASGTEKTEAAAWAKAEDQWNTSRARLTAERAVQK